MSLLIIFILAELIFLIWSLRSKNRHDREKSIVRIIELIVVAILLVTGVLEWGMRYYFIVGVLAVQILYGIIRWNKMQAMNYKSGRQARVFIGNFFLYFAALIPALLFPESKLPQVTGPYEVVIKEYTWVDESQVETYTDTGEKRAITVKIWYPKEQDEKYPLIVFSHGAFGVIDSNYSTCMELASNGYVAVSIAHPYHAMYVKDTNGKVTFADSEFVKSIYAVNDSANEEVVYEQSKKWMKIRTEDENFVIDTILKLSAELDTKEADSPFGLIDVKKIGLLGHSMGGASSVQLGRERDDIGAVIDLEGSMFGEYTGVKDGVGVYKKEPYPIPILDVYSEEIYNAAKQYPDDVFCNFYLGKRAANYEYVIFKDAGHLNFTDLPIISPILAGILGKGSVDARICMENVNEMVLTFFNAYLKGEGEPILKKEY